jgi:hypothetical protein
MVQQAAQSPSDSPITLERKKAVEERIERLQGLLRALKVVTDVQEDSDARTDASLAKIGEAVRKRWSMAGHACSGTPPTSGCWRRHACDPQKTRKSTGRILSLSMSMLLA